MRRILLPLLIVCFIPFSSAGQDVIEVEGARGVGVIAGRVSEMDARRDAVNDAKVEALRMAGITEHLQSYELLFTSQHNQDYSQFFSTDIHAELQGAVQSYEIVSDRRRQNPETNLFEVEVVIHARVVKYDVRPDPGFAAEIKGIKGIYDEGELLEFSVHSSQNAYLHVFNINDHEAYLMYPNPWEEFRQIDANSEKNFPFGYVDYYLEKATGETETNRLIFVFTKNPLRFRAYQGEEQTTTPERIFAWIYGISPDLRTTDYQTFVIR